MTLSSSSTNENWQSYLPKIAFLAVVVIVIVVTIYVWFVFPVYNNPLFFLAVLVGLVGIFPLSYVAYLGFGARAHRRRLRDDFRILGLVNEEELDETVEKLYQTAYSPTQFGIFIAFTVLFSLLMCWGLLYPDSVRFISPETMKLMFFSFLGAYTFSVQDLIRRYNTYDLQPQIYSSIFSRMFISVLITFSVASFIILSGGQLSEQSNTPNNAMTGAAVLAFIIGVFPSRGLRWLTEQAERVLGSKAELPDSSRPLQNIIGISAWHEARLAEMGIDDGQNLATADLRKLLLTTQFDTQQIVSWVDQAILYCKVGQKLERYRDAKIHTFHELLQILRDLSVNPIQKPPQDVLEQQQEKRKLLATALGLSAPDELERLADFSNYPNYAYIAEFYAASAKVAHQRANRGLEVIVGALQDTNYERAVAEGEDQLQRNPENVQILLRLATAYYHIRKLDAAETAYSRALQLEPALAQAYYGRSLIYKDQKKYQEAIRDCTDAIRISPTLETAFNNRGLAYLQIGYLDLAIRDFDEALDLNLRFSAAYFNRGIAFLMLYNFEGAVGDFEHAYLLDEKSDSLWYFWGVALIGTRNYQEAIHKLSNAVLYESANLALAFGRRGYAYMQLGEKFYQQARMDLETAIQKDGGLWEAHGNLGLLEAYLHNDAAAVAHYDVVLKAMPSLYTFRFNRAQAYSRLEKFDLARQDFEQVLQEAAPDSPEAKDAQVYLVELDKKTGEQSNEPTN